MALCAVVLHWGLKDATELQITLSSEWKTSEFLKAKMDQAKGPEAYAKTICRHEEGLRKVLSFHIGDAAVLPIWLKELQR